MSRSSSSNALTVSLKATAAVTRGFFVKMGTADETCTKITASTDIAIGVAMNSAASGEMVNVAYAGVVRCVVGSGNVTRGKVVALDNADTDGGIEDAAALSLTAGGSTDNNAIAGHYPTDGLPLGIALESGTSNEEVLVRLGM